MKLERLKKIIKEELSTILKEMASSPAKEKEETETIEKETEKEKEKKRRGFDKPEPGVNPKPKANLKETEKELINKITARFQKSKKVNEMLSLIDDKDLKNYTPSPEITDGEIKTMSLEQVKSAYNELKNEWDTPSKRIMVKKLRDRIEVLKPDYFQKSKK